MDLNSLQEAELYTLPLASSFTTLNLIMTIPFLPHDFFPDPEAQKE